jgi:hypothetical protein
MFVFLFCFLWSIAVHSQTYYRAIIFYDNINDISSYLNHQEIDVVHNYERFTKHVDVYVSSSYYNTLENAGLNITLTATTVDESHKSYILGQRWDSQYGYYPKYGHHDSLLEYYETNYPAIAKTGVLPVKSHFGRDIFFMKISNSPNSDNKKPEVCIHGIIHGDEPIGSGIVRDGIDYLCKNYNTDPEIKWLVDNRQIYFIPVMNVERFIWNENQRTKDARKRRTMDYKNGSSSTTESNGGVDPNRNFPYKWAFDNSGSSSNPTANNYRGQRASDQKCVQAIIEFFKLHKFRFWNVYHSSGEKVLVPFGHTRNLKLDSYDSTAYYSVYHEWRKFYTAFDGCGPSWEYYFPINGSTEDWAWSSDDTTSKVYGYITELGPGTGGTYWFNDATSKSMSEKMVQCDIFMAKAAGFYPVLDNIRISDPLPGGNNDGKLNPGETVKLFVTIENKSAVDTTNVTSYLRSQEPVIFMKDTVAAYGDIEHVETVENSSDPFEFSCHKSAVTGSYVKFNVNYTWTINTASFEKALACSLQVGEYVSISNNTLFDGKRGLDVVNNNRLISFHVHVPQEHLFTGSNDVQMKIYDISGRTLRNLDFTATDRSSRIYWDKTDNSGKRITSGVYFLKVAVNNFHAVQKFEVIQ